MSIWASILRARFAIGVLLLAIIAVASTHVSALEPERPGQESFLTRAVFAEERLWVLSDAGRLSSITESHKTPIAETLPEKALDLCVHKGQPVIVTGTKEAHEWSLRQRSDETWATAAVIQTEGDQLLAMDCSASRIVLLTSQRLIELDSDRQNAVRLSQPLKGGLISSTFGTADQLYVGINAGEWGGGLRRIDRRSGDITIIGSSSGDDLCTGPLNTACDPVNGISAEPGKPDCIIAAIGLIHFKSHGRIIEVCEGQVRRLYYKPYGDGHSSHRDSGDAPSSTVAFFGLTGEGDTLWAVGTDGLYAISLDGVAQVIPLPHFIDTGGISVSFDLPRFVLVLTNANQRQSVSGAVPLLVPR